MANVLNPERDFPLAFPLIVRELLISASGRRSLQGLDVSLKLPANHLSLPKARLSFGAIIASPQSPSEAALSHGFSPWQLDRHRCFAGIHPHDDLLHALKLYGEGNMINTRLLINLLEFMFAGTQKERN